MGYIFDKQYLLGEQNMTDEQLWDKLDKLAAKGTSGKNILEFAGLLIQAYTNGLNIFEIGIIDNNDEDIIYQLYSGEFDDRIMHCSTTFEKGKKTVMKMDKNGMLPPDSKICVTDVSCKTILDNLYFKKEISALVFNAHMEDQVIIPAELLRPLIKASGKASLPQNFAPANLERYKERSGGKSKKPSSVKEWAAKKCPPAYLVLLFDGRCDDLPLEEEEYLAKIFCSQWKNVKKYIEKQNKKNGKASLDDFVIDYPDKEIAEELSVEFFNIMNVVDMYLWNTNRYSEYVDFCQDMLELFENDSEYKSELTGRIGSGLWAQSPADGEKYFKEHLTERNDIIMGHYSFYLLSDERWDDAAEAMKGYEDTEDDTLIERFEWLKNRK
jgi:hypothetical protein